MALSRKDGGSPPRNLSPDAATYLILSALAFLPYSNIFFNQFVYDDGMQVVGNPYAHSFKYLREIFTTTVWSFQGAQGASNYYRPMMTLGYLVTYQLAGLIPFTYHLVSILLNAVVVCLVFAILRRFSGDRVALIAAGLFALHPIHTEAVAWIAAVTDLELSVFYLAAFLLYLTLPEAKNTLRARALLCFTFALALLSKEQAMTLPVLAMLYEYFYRDDRAATSHRAKLARYGPLWIVAAVYLAVRIAVLRGFTSVLMRPNLSWHDTLLSAVALLGQYLGKLVWPARLSPFYIFEPSTGFIDKAFLLGVAALALCAVLFLALWKRAHIVSFAFACIFLPLAPALNARWMPASVFGERYLYLPSLGFCWLLAWAAVRLWSSHAGGAPSSQLAARAIPAMLGLLAIFWGARTISRNRGWRDDVALYQSALANQGDASLIRANLGSAEYNRGDTARAEADWQDALAVSPNNIHALDSMATLRREERRYDESLAYSEKALQLRPVDTFGHTNIGVTLAALGRKAEAESHFRTATELSPLSTGAHNAYGQFLLLSGRAEEARNQFELSADADFNTDANDLLGAIYLEWKDFPRAERAYRASLKGDPFNSRAHFGLGAVLELTGRNAEALREYDSGLALDPSDAGAKAAMARLRAQTP